MAADINKIFSKEALSSIDIAIKKMTELELKTDALLKKAMALNKALAKANGLQKNTEQVKANNKAKTEAQKIHKQYQSEIKKTEKVYGNMNRALIRQRTERTKATKMIKLEQQALNSAKGSYKQLDAQMRLNIAKLKEMSAKERETTKAGKQLTATIKKQYAALSRMDKQMGSHHKNVGNYKSALGGASKALGMFGVMLGGAAIIQGFRKLIGLGAAFEKQMSRVAAVSGATGPQMQALTQDAMRLGANTEKTAKQVGDLQMELAKLGLVAKDIISVTGAILDMATASDADLGQAASVAAKTMKGFGLQAKDMNRIVDVMAKSFSSSALDISKFETAMSDVAPTAKAFGESIERSSAKLSTLVDNGLDASKAGTSLRNMYLELSKRGLTWNEAMKLIEESTNKNTTALELFGKRGAVAGLILADNQNRVEQLTGVYERSAGAAKQMADIMRDNLSGSFDKAKSATQGLGITIMDGLNRPIREAVDGFTSFITAINDSMATIKTQTELIQEEQTEVNTLIQSIASLNEDNEIRQSLLDELIENYPDLIGNIDTENISNEALLGVLKDINLEYQKRIALSAIGEELKKSTERNTELFVRQREIIKGVNAAYERYIDDKKEGATFQEKANALQEAESLSLQAIVEDWANVEDATGVYEQIDARLAVVNNATTALEEYTQAEKERAVLTNEAQVLIKEMSVIEGESKEKIVVTTTAIKKQSEAVSGLAADLAAFNAEMKAAALTESLEDFDEPELPVFKDEKPPDEWRTNADYYEDLWRKTYKGRLQTLKDMLAAGEIAEDEYTDRVKELRIQRAQEGIDLAAHVAASAFSIYQESIDRQIGALETQKQYELGLAEGSRERQQEINEKFAKKEAELRTKKAKADKAAALIQAIMNTASAIVLATSSAPGPAGIAMAIITAAFNAVQLATIAATPIPQFKKGGKQKKSGAAIISEIGPELLVGPRGDIELSGSKGAEMRWLEAGTQIIPNAETSKILSAAGKGGDSLVMAQLAGVIQQGDKEIIRAIKNKKELTIIPAKSKINERKGNYFTTYLNAKIKT